MSALISKNKFTNAPLPIVAGKYKVIRKIANGSFGHVFMAIDTTNDKEVAIKFELANVSSVFYVGRSRRLIGQFSLPFSFQKNQIFLVATSAIGARSVGLQVFNGTARHSRERHSEDFSRRIGEWLELHGKDFLRLLGFFVSLFM